MDLTGATVIAAPRDRVWAFVSDPAQIGWCAPGVESIEALDATHFRAQARVGVGFFSVGLVILLELGPSEAPERAVLNARGEVSGVTVEATSAIRLSGPPDGPTSLAWTVSTAVSGSAAGLPLGAIEGTFTKQLAQAFDCARAKLEA